MYIPCRNTVYATPISLLALIRVLSQVFMFPRSSFAMFFLRSRGRTRASLSTGMASIYSPSQLSFVASIVFILCNGVICLCSARIFTKN